MIKAILGRKIGMTQIFSSDGCMCAVTVIQADDCCVVQKKSRAKDGYDAVQLGYGGIANKNVNKPMMGHFSKAGVLPKRHLKEYRPKVAEDIDSLSVGAKIGVDIFKDGSIVDVTGTSKGHGFTGTVKRWGTHRGPKSHGSGYHRGVGSMGAAAHPARVVKGKKLPGHFGNERVTVQNLTIAKIIKNGSIILLKGAVPGPNGGVVLIRMAVKSDNVD